jgi:CubicO group peptidase (beta-lactamase class C family)
MRILLLLIFVFTASGEDGKLSGELDAYVASRVAARKFMGAVLVSRDGQVVLKKGYGMANLELDVPNKPETKFRLGSITKQFVAVGILQLEEKGKLRVQEPICKYVPECPDAWGKITIHHLLSHTSGIPNFTSFPDYAKTWMLPSRPEQTMTRFKNKPLDFQPGEKWSYSNSAYILLGYLLEKISGEKYEEYIRKYVLDPAGMADSGHDTHEAILKNRAAGYSRRQGDEWINSAYHDMTIPIGGGDLYSTVEDLYKWDQALMSNKILTSESREKMFTPVMNNYGYGWGIDKQYGRARYAHGGGINGFATFYARFPEQRAVVAVLGNMDFANSGEIASNLVRVLFGEKLVRPEDRKPVSIDSSKLGNYVGRYEAASGQNATISVDGGKLMALISGSPREEVLPEAADRFFYRSTDRVLVFERGTDGKVTGMTVHREGIETEWKRVSTEAPPQPKEISVSAEHLSELVGEYELTPAFSIAVTMEGGKLFGQATGQPKFELFAEDKDKFFLKVVEAKMEFQRGADGKVNQLTLHQGGRQLPMKRK